MARRTVDAVKRTTSAAVDSLYTYVSNEAAGHVDPDGRYPWSPYHIYTGPSGEYEVYVEDDCSIVLLNTHGIAKSGTLSTPQQDALDAGTPGVLLTDAQVVPQVFFFEKKCQAGGVLSCFAATSNKAIPEKFRSGGLNVEGGKNVSLSILPPGVGGVEEEWWSFGYWSKLAKDSLEATAKGICTKKPCSDCCKEITVYWVSKGWDVPVPPFSKKVYPCNK